MKYILLYLFSVLFMLMSCGIKNSKKSINVTTSDSIIEINTQSGKYKIIISGSGYLKSVQQYQDTVPDGVDLRFNKDGSFQSVSHIKNKKVNGDVIVYYPYPHNKISTWYNVRYSGESRVDNEWKSFYEDGNILYHKSHFLDLNIVSDSIGVYAQVMAFNPYFKDGQLMMVSNLDSNYNVIAGQQADTIKNIKVGDRIPITKDITSGEKDVYLQFITIFNEDGIEKGNTIFKHLMFIIP